MESGSSEQEVGSSELEVGSSELEARSSEAFAGSSDPIARVTALKKSDSRVSIGPDTRPDQFRFDERMTSLGHRITDWSLDN